MRKFWQEFKDFINQGNVMDLAVGVVIGAAFTAIVDSVVSDLVMPLISAITGGIDFSDMKVVLPFGAGESAITYGNFINAVIQFIILALVVFLIVKLMNSMRSAATHGKSDEVTEPPKCPYCMEEIPEGATRCPHCTAELPEPAKSTVTNPKAEEKAEKKKKKEEAADMADKINDMTDAIADKSAEVDGDVEKAVSEAADEAADAVEEAEAAGAEAAEAADKADE